MGDILLWAGIALGVLAGIFLAIIVWGMFLPKTHRVARAIRTAKSPEEVWAVITDFPASPGWHKGIMKVERLPDVDGREVWRETYKSNYPIKLATTEAVPPRRLVRTIADEKGPFSGRWEFDLSAEGSGTRVTITEVGEVPNPFFRFMARKFMDPALYLEAYLTALAERLGEAPAVEKVVPLPS
jgi:uncharacterized protein YndB with AHSA1/START domain